MTTIPLTVAFTAGLVSFLSPCVLPLLPAFLAYLAGGQLAEGTAKRRVIFLTSLVFVLGFGTVFALVGTLLNTLLEAVAYDAQQWLARVGGLIIIIFGLTLAGLIKLPSLGRRYQLTPRLKRPSPFIGAFVFGAAFAAGWTPCVGAVLGSVLGLAAAEPGSALTLLLVYALGFGLPFLAVGAFTSQASVLIGRYQAWLIPARRVFGIILVILGLLAFTQSLNRIANLETLFPQ